MVLQSNSEPNHSPILLEPPIDLAYVGQYYVHTPNAYDPDGDSLAYELIVPFMDEDEPVPGYLPVTDISAGPDNQLYMDPETGKLVWDAPQMTGLYNIAYLVKSYREGVLLDQVVRDMQIEVVEGLNIPPTLELDVAEDVIHEIAAGDTVRIELQASDMESDQELTMTATSGLFIDFEEDVAFTTDIIGNAGSAYFEWIVREEHIREQAYQIVFKLKDDFGLFGAARIAVVRYKVLGSLNQAEELHEAVKIAIMPNPVAEQLYLNIPQEIESASYHLMDAQGNLMQSGRVFTGTAGLDLSSLPSGTYWLRFFWDNSSELYPVVIQR